MLPAHDLDAGEGTDLDDESPSEASAGSRSHRRRLSEVSSNVSSIHLPESESPEVVPQMFSPATSREVLSVVTWADLLDDPSEMAAQAATSTTSIWQTSSSQDAAPMSAEAFAAFVRSSTTAACTGVGAGRALQLPTGVVGKDLPIDDLASTDAASSGSVTTGHSSPIEPVSNRAVTINDLGLGFGLTPSCGGGGVAWLPQNPWHQTWPSGAPPAASVCQGARPHSEPGARVLDPGLKSR
ncbi:unnamed protein product [Symbiodinium natans]|uniref:Uncharacterized protein n=1 Tax=Symbiodinium natans TaxID=878477 RepID=A0A812RXA7_9DINO|nr:unnamed protein product [Symbiodinium natans]